jgi:hypothetical protein
LSVFANDQKWTALLSTERRVGLTWAIRHLAVTKRTRYKGPRFTTVEPVTIGCYAKGTNAVYNLNFTETTLRN